MQGFEPPPLAYEARTTTYTTRPPWQVSLKGVKVCAWQGEVAICTKFRRLMYYIFCVILYPIEFHSRFSNLL